MDPGHHQGVVEAGGTVHHSFFVIVGIGVVVVGGGSVVVGGGGAVGSPVVVGGGPVLGPGGRVAGTPGSGGPNVGRPPKAGDSMGSNRPSCGISGGGSGGGRKPTCNGASGGVGGGGGGGGGGYVAVIGGAVGGVPMKNGTILWQLQGQSHICPGGHLNVSCMESAMDSDLSSEEADATASCLVCDWILTKEPLTAPMSCVVGMLIGCTRAPVWPDANRFNSPTLSRIHKNLILSYPVSKVHGLQAQELWMQGVNHS